MGAGRPLWLLFFSVDPTPNTSQRGPKNSGQCLPSKYATMSFFSSFFFDVLRALTHHSGKKFLTFGLVQGHILLVTLKLTQIN